MTVGWRVALLDRSKVNKVHCHWNISMVLLFVPAVLLLFCRQSVVSANNQKQYNTSSFPCQHYITMDMSLFCLAELTLTLLYLDCCVLMLCLYRVVCLYNGLDQSVCVCVCLCVHACVCVSNS